jgi:hypothetical protein
MDTLTSAAIGVVIAEETARLLKKRNKGYTFSLKTVVDKLKVIDFVNGEPHAKLSSITIYNDGEDEVYASVNTHVKNAPIKPHEILNIDFSEPMIEKLYLDIDEGKTTVVRIFGIY